jgi:hypothetical protein
MVAVVGGALRKSGEVINIEQLSSRLSPDAIATPLPSLSFPSRLLLLLGLAVVMTTLGEVPKQRIATGELRGADSAETFGLLLHNRLALLWVCCDHHLSHLPVVLLLVEGFPAQRLVLLAERALELLVLAD